MSKGKIKIVGKLVYDSAAALTRDLKMVKELNSAAWIIHFSFMKQKGKENNNFIQHTFRVDTRKKNYSDTKLASTFKIIR